MFCFLLVFFVFGFVELIAVYLGLWASGWLICVFLGILDWVLI